jgi:hypothetical protein
MPRIALAAVIVVLVSAASAEEEPGQAFERARADAHPTEGLTAFLAKYVGECTEESGPQCKKAADEYRRQVKGKRLYLAVEDPGQMLQVGARGGEEGAFTMHLTPFFPAGGYALTSGAPKRTDGRGNPVMPLMRLAARAPDGDVDRLERMLSMRQLRVEVVFTPEGTWSLPRKAGGGPIQGVKARLHAVKISLARTGETVAVWTGR